MMQYDSQVYQLDCLNDYIQIQLITYYIKCNKKSVLNNVSYYVLLGI